MGLENETNNSSDEEREAMVVQMRDECCLNASFLDLDRVLRELQEKVIDASSDFSRIGPFGILPLNQSSPLPETPPETKNCELQVIDQHGRISTPDLNLSLSQFAWGELDDIQDWEPLDSALISFSRLNSEKGSVNGDISANWEAANASQSYAYDVNGSEMTLACSQYGSKRQDQTVTPTFETALGR